MTSSYSTTQRPLKIKWNKDEIWDEMTLKIFIDTLEKLQKKISDLEMAVSCAKEASKN